LRGPEVFGISSHLVAAAHLLLALLVLVSVGLAIRYRAWRTLSTDLRIHAMSFAGCGVSLHALGVLVHPHYLIVFSPMLHVLTAWVLAQRVRYLWLTCSLQLFLTVTFLWFIHAHGGAPHGDYGVAYRAQTPEQRALLGR
jgi:hypothetical protein